ncbi:hypothetical protein OAI86_02655 [Alphaproteobacteria bacterium]|nr:hypothetical protein [Alphaproteobacteria bacterium]
MNIFFPIWLVALDYILAIIMFILILKFILNIFINEGSSFYIFRFFTKLTQPILSISAQLTPKFIVRPIIPLYLGWLIFMIRIYMLPLLLGYSFSGKFAFIFEKDLTNLINSSILNIALYLNYGI